MRRPFHLRRQFLSHVLFPFIGLASIACGSSSSGTPTPAKPGHPAEEEVVLGPVVASAPIGPQGGSVATPDGTIKVDLPAGALGETAEITVQERSAPNKGEVGVVYEIGPTGTQFSSPVTLTIAYSPEDLKGEPEDQLKIAVLADGHWQALADNAVDTKAHSVSGTTMHLSPYADVILPPEADAGVAPGGGGGAPNGAGGAGGSPDVPVIVGQGGMMIDPGSGGAPNVDPGSGGASTVEPGSGGTPNVDPGTGGTTGAGATNGTGGKDTGTAGSTSLGGGPAVDPGSGGRTGTGATNGAGGKDPGTAGGTSLGGTTGVGGDTTGTAGRDPGTAGSTSAGGGTSIGGAPNTETCFSDAAQGPAGGPNPTCETAKPCFGFPDAYVRDCVNTSTGYTATCCSSTGPVGAGGTAGTGGSSTGTGGGPAQGCFGDGAVGPPGGPYPSCETSDVCSSYPGTAVVDCMNTPDGYKASCCFASPVDPGTGGASSGGATGSGGTVGGGGSCIGVGADGPPGGPYPSCETSDPCAAYPGSELMDCANSSTGYKAMCCSTGTIDPGGGGAPSGGGTGGTGGTTSGGGACVGVAENGPPGGPYPTCENSDPCAPYPGAYLSDCVNSPEGYKAMCCSSTIDPGGGGMGGTAGSGGVPNTGGAGGTGGAAGSCVGFGEKGPPGGPYPSCETSDPCARFPGTSLSDCVNTPEGYDAMCCSTGTVDPGTGGTASGGVPNAGGTGGTTTGGESCMGVGEKGPPGGPYPSCETSDPCGQFAGAYVRDCINTTDGYEAMCCSSTPIDPGTGGAPAGGATGTGGTSSGGGCIGVDATGPQGGPYPSCESSDPCAPYPGSVLSDCVNTPSGYKGMCCSTVTNPGTGGTTSTGGTAGTGGRTGTGGTAGTGGAPIGGAPSGGTAGTGGRTGTGGAPSGGTAGTGGAPIGGAPSGGAPSGSCVPDVAQGSCATACSTMPGTIVSGCVDMQPSGHKSMCCTP